MALMYLRLQPSGLSIDSLASEPISSPAPPAATIAAPIAYVDG